MQKETRIITFYSRKGGVGKSTISFNVACVLASQGFVVLYIDFDPQCNTGRAYLGLTREEMNDAAVNYNSVLNLVGVDIENDEKDVHVHIPKKNPTELIYNVEDFSLYSIKGSNSVQDYFNMDKKFAANPMTLKESMDQLRGMFDYIIIDTNPAETDLEMNVLIASDYIICPCAPSSDDLGGIEGLREKFLPMCQKYNPYLKCLGIVINRVKTSNAQQREFIDIDILQQAKRIGGKLFKYEISEAVLLSSLKNESFYMNKPNLDRPMSVVDMFVRKDSNYRKTYGQFKRLTDEIMAEIIMRDSL